ncbi:MAG: hypothetical protein K940chlam3_00926 [Chlamydiae bacterium]|nr:hypothetical protein [Chlamydiota bacterium]
MSFEMRINDIIITDVGQANACLSTWSRFIEETGYGKMTVLRDGEVVEVKIIEKDDDKAIDLKMSDIRLHHTYKYIHEICSSGCPELSKHFFVEVSGNDTASKPVKFSLYINHTCEDGRSWYKSFLLGRLQNG